MHIICIKLQLKNVGQYYFICLILILGFPGSSDRKKSPAVKESWIQCQGQKDFLKGMATHFSILAGEFHGQRSLYGYSSWGHRESDTTEWLTL